MFVICEKSILQILEKIIRYCYLKRTRCYKVVYKAAVATGEFIWNKISDKGMKSKPVSGTNSKNVEK